MSLIAASCTRGSSAAPIRPPRCAGLPSHAAAERAAGIVPLCFERSFVQQAEQDAHILEVLVSQMRQHRDIDAVLSETLGVLGQAEPSEPIRNLLHRQPPTDLTLSVLDRQESLPYAPHVVAPRRKVARPVKVRG